MLSTQSRGTQSPVIVAAEMFSALIRASVPGSRLWCHHKSDPTGADGPCSSMPARYDQAEPTQQPRAGPTPAGWADIIAGYHHYKLAEVRGALEPVCDSVCDWIRHQQTSELPSDFFAGMPLYERLFCLLSGSLTRRRPLDHDRRRICSIGLHLRIGCRVPLQLFLTPRPLLSKRSRQTILSPEV